MRHIYRNDVFTMTLRVYDLEGGGGSFDLGFGKIKDAVHAAAKAELDGLKQELKDASGLTAVEQEFEALKADLQKQWNEFRDGVKKGLFEAFGFQMPEEERPVENTESTEKPEDASKTTVNRIKFQNNSPLPNVPEKHMRAVSATLSRMQEVAETRQDELRYVADASRKYGIPEAYLMAVIARESNWDSKAMNGGLGGAVGLGQIIPSTRDLLLKGHKELKDRASKISGDPRLNAEWNAHAAAALIKDNARTLKLDVQDSKNWVVLSVAYHDGSTQAQQFMRGSNLKMVSGYKGYQKRFDINVHDDASYTQFVRSLAEEYSWAAQAVDAGLKDGGLREIEVMDLGPDFIPFESAGFSISKSDVKRGDLPYKPGRFGENRGDHIHEGVDIANIKEGAPIVLSQGATLLRKAYEADGAGHHAVVRLDSGKTFKFFHLQTASLLQPGQHYEPGTVMGRVGNTGHSSGTHIHFEEEGADGKALDPTAYFSALPQKGEVVG